MRKSFIPALVIAASALAGIGFAAAQDPGPSPSGASGSMMMHDRHHGFTHHRKASEHLEGRLAFLKTELAIKSGQEAVWNDFVAAARKAAKTTDAARSKDGDGSRRDLKVPDRLDRAEARLTARLEALKTIRKPAERLYAALDETQQKTADDLFMGPMGMRMR